MADVLHQQAQHAEPVPVFRDRVPDPIDLALQLRAQGRVEIVGLEGRLYLALQDPDGSVWYGQCPVCHAWSSECLSLVEARDFTCGRCQEQRLAETRQRRLTARLDHARSVPDLWSRKSTRKD